MGIWGVPVKEIAFCMGRSREWVYIIFRKEGINLKSRKLGEEK